MRTKLLLFAVVAFCSIARDAKSDVILYVHFGDVPTTVDEQTLANNYTPNGENTVTTSYYLQLTEGSTLYAYRFSVRYSEKLTFDPLLFPVMQTQPPPLVANPNLIPTDKGSHKLNGFYGADKSTIDGSGTPDQLSGNGFYKVASTTFIISPGTDFTPGERLVEPGQYELDTNDLALDVFNSEDDKYNANNSKFFPAVRGGYVTAGTIVSVPEPSSFLLIAVITLAWVISKRIMQLV